jgi:5'-3' exonuclease
LKPKPNTNATPEYMWDQNALTPGSEFMAKLNAILVSTAKNIATRMGIEVIVSPTSEPGEGEHKLLAHMRTVRPDTCMIYGLDADLLLLSLLLMGETGAEVHLLREAQEFERTDSMDSTGVQWKTLSIRAMVKAMKLDSVNDFVAVMSLLGNDFLPRSMTRTIRKDGIPQILGSLTRLHARGQTILVGEHIQKESLLILLREWAATEEEDMLHAARDALRERYYPIRCDPDDLPSKEWQMLPSRWATLSCLLRTKHKDSLLRSDWRDIYRSWHSGSPKDYCEGLAWIWDYYSGRPIDHAWMFDHPLPPLWSDLVAYLEHECETLQPPPIVYPTPLPEWLHLFAVLPAHSIVRLLPPHVQRLMAKEPLYWPTQWSVFDIGRSQMWECEPIIPILSEAILRSFVRTLKS